MNWDEDQIKRIYEKVDAFLKELFKCEVRSLEDAKNLTNIITARLIATSMSFSYGYGVGSEQQEQERRRMFDRLKKPPPYLA